MTSPRSYDDPPLRTAVVEGVALAPPRISDYSFQSIRDAGNEWNPSEKLEELRRRAFQAHLTSAAPFQAIETSRKPQRSVSSPSVIEHGDSNRLSDESAEKEAAERVASISTLEKLLHATSTVQSNRSGAEQIHAESSSDEDDSIRPRGLKLKGILTKPRPSRMWDEPSFSKAVHYHQNLADVLYFQRDDAEVTSASSAVDELDLAVGVAGTASFGFMHSRRVLTSVRNRPPTPFTRSRDPSPDLVIRARPSRRTSSPHSASPGVSSGATTPDLIPFDKDSPPGKGRWFGDESFDLDGLGAAVTAIGSVTMREDHYLYTKINPAQIRLLRLHKGNPQDDLSISTCVLDFTELKRHNVEYYALSYYWGTDLTTDTVMIGDASLESLLSDTVDRSTFKAFLVRSNLHAALKHMRSDTEDFWMWVDALSIDQNNDEEKSEQIPNMLRIYSTASSVCIWLGEPDETDSRLEKAHAPLEFVHFLVNLKLLDQWLQSGKPDETIAASLVTFAKLLRRPWFHRRWVIQEVSAADEASVHYGTSKIHWVDFADAVQLFLAHIDKLRAIYRKCRLFTIFPDALDYVESSGAVALVGANNNLVKRTASNQILTLLWSIEALVTTFSSFEASDPRDVIYGLLSLALDGPTQLRENGKQKDKGRARLNADYTQCAHFVHVQFVQHVIESTGSLDIICRHWAPENHSCAPNNEPLPCVETRPSWISSVATSPFGPPSRSTGRVNGDSLIGRPGQSQYKSSRAEPPSASISLGIGQPVLLARGIALGTIRKRSSRVVNGIIPRDCFEISGWQRNMPVDDVPDCLWRTLVADRTSDGQKTPSWWRRACMHCLTQIDYNGDLNTARVMEGRQLPQIAVDGFLKRVQSVVWNRRFFLLECRETRTDEKVAALGLGPPDVQKDDIVCVLFGCSVPVVMRLVPGSYRYRLVGECFVHERMDGEAIAMAELDGFENVQDFVIV